MAVTQEYLDSLITMGRKFLKPDWSLWDPDKSPEGLKEDKPQKIKFELKNPIKIDMPSTRVGKKINTCIQERKSCREYLGQNITLSELAELLWATTKKATPTAGEIDGINTYLYINNVEGLGKGFYYYCPEEKSLYLINKQSDLKESIDEDFYSQIKDSAVVFLWAAVPALYEYKYTVVCHKMMAIEAGHKCQNLYLSAANLDLGCCAIGAYNQGVIDKLLKLDEQEEYVVYSATVGKKRNV